MGARDPCRRIGRQGSRALCLLVPTEQRACLVPLAGCDNLPERFARNWRYFNGMQRFRVLAGPAAGHCSYPPVAPVPQAGFRPARVSPG